MMDEYTTQKIKDLLGTQVLKKTGFTAGGCINEGEGYETDNGIVFIKKNSSSHVNINFIEFFGYYIMFSSACIKCSLKTTALFSRTQTITHYYRFAFYLPCVDVILRNFNFRLNKCLIRKYRR